MHCLKLAQPATRLHGAQHKHSRPSPTHPRTARGASRTSHHVLIAMLLLLVLVLVRRRWLLPPSGRASPTLSHRVTHATAMWRRPAARRSTHHGASPWRPTPWWRTSLPKEPRRETTSRATEGARPRAPASASARSSTGTARPEPASTLCFTPQPASLYLAPSL